MMAERRCENDGVWLLKGIFFIGWLATVVGAGFIHPGLGLMVVGASLMWLMAMILAYEVKP